MVVAEHIRAPLFPGWAELPLSNRNFLVRTWFFFTGFGFESVVLFFVLSGYLIGGYEIGKVRNKRWLLIDYAINRISRLYIVLIPALILTIILDNVGEKLFSTVGFWNGSNQNFLLKFAGPLISRDTPSNLACNLAMLQTFYCDVLGTNVPLWTLSYEFWFYVVFGCFATVLAAKSTPKVIALLLIVAIFFILGTGFLWMLSVWFLGTLACLYRGSRFRWPAISVSTWFGLATISRMNDVGSPSGVINNLIVVAEGAAFAWVLVSFSDKRYLALQRIEPLVRWFASFSYTLYLIHFPFMLFLIGCLAWLLKLDVHHGVLPASALGLSLYLIVMVGVLASAWAVAKATERQTDSFRVWLRYWLNLSKPPR